MGFCHQSIIILVTFMSFITTGSCTKCYQCTSEDDVKCGETFTSTIEPVDCSTDAYNIFNQLNTYDILPSEAFGGTAASPRNCFTISTESGTVIRTCLDTDANKKNELCKTILQATATTLPEYNKVKTCKECDKDNCNGAGLIPTNIPKASGAGALSSSVPLFILTSIISFLVYKV